METAAQSGDPEIAEELLRFYVEQKERECFAAALFTCYDLIRPDVALEVSRSVPAKNFNHESSRCNMKSCQASPISKSIVQRPTETAVKIRGILHVQTTASPLPGSFCVAHAY